MRKPTERRMRISMPQEDLELLDRGAKAERLPRSAFLETLTLWKAAGYPEGFWDKHDAAKE